VIEPIERDARTVLDADAEHDAHAHEPHGVDPIEVARVGFVALAAVAVWFRLWEPVAALSVIGVTATLVGGYPIFKEAVENIAQRRMTMELSMTIALVAALAIGQAFTALVITAFVLAAEILEHLTVARGRAAIGDLLSYLPQTALVRRKREIEEVRVDSLCAGEIVLVNPGALVPVDGVVIAGHSFVDEARITGESMPAEKTAGSPAYAGTINGSGVLEVRVERLGRDTSFGRIIEAVESAERSRAPIERLADRLAGYLVYFALGAAVLTFLVTRNVVATISVIIVAGACGIAAGTPLAVLGAVGRAARAGAVIKGGRYLEALAAAEVVVFDKTGTVTFGTPTVKAVDPAPGTTAQTLLALAAAAEVRSEHPIGRAIAAEARLRGIAVAEPESFEYRPGRGIRVTLDDETIAVGSAAFLRDEGCELPDALPANDAVTAVLVACGACYLGSISVADIVRPEAPAAMQRLRRLRIRTVLLTGDLRAVAEGVGHAIGVDDVHAELLPEQKSAYIAQLVNSGKVVVMVGDGVNDAPALVAATVGVAMGSGTDVARESADIVLLGNDLGRFVETLLIARRTKTIVMQNFAGTLAVDAVGIVLAAFGLLSPLLAAFIHVASELTFILNSTRMLAPPQRVKARLGATATRSR
jgi:heavy metal translocating P-type ATPase